MKRTLLFPLLIAAVVFGAVSTPLAQVTVSDPVTRVESWTATRTTGDAVTTSGTLNNTTGTLTISTQPGQPFLNVVADIHDNSVAGALTADVIITGTNQDGITVVETLDDVTSDSAASFTCWASITSITWANASGYAASDSIRVFWGSKVGVVERFNDYTDIVAAKQTTRSWTAAGTAETVSITASGSTTGTCTVTTSTVPTTYTLDMGAVLVTVNDISVPAGTLTITQSVSTTSLTPSSSNTSGVYGWVDFTTVSAGDEIVIVVRRKLPTTDRRRLKFTH